MALKRASKRVIVTTEAVNYYKFRVLTDGIELSLYDRNPVMLWMHTRAFGNKETMILPLGNVIELKVEVHPDLGRVITGLPVFDDTDEFAMKIYEKYEAGVVRMASAGLRPEEWSIEPELLLPGQTGATLTKSVLEEISLVDIGGNSEAVQVALYSPDGQKIELSASGGNSTIPLIQHPQIEQAMNKIELTAAAAASLIGMQEINSSEQFENKVAEIVQLAARQKNQIESLAREKIDLTEQLEQEKKVNLDARIDRLVTDAVTERRITAEEKESYVKLAAADFGSVEKLLKAKPSQPSLQVKLAQSAGETIGTIAGKTWRDLDKEGKLVQLKKEDYNTFCALFKAEFGVEYKA